MPKKIRRRKKHKKLLQQANLKKDLEAAISSDKATVDKKDETYYLTVDERYRVVMEFTRKILEKITVSYEIEIDGRWITVKLYDNTHAVSQLHRHTKKSINDPMDIIGSDGVIKRGGPSEWLNWARRDILKKGYYYKQAFLKRSKLVDK